MIERLGIDRFRRVNGAAVFWMLFAATGFFILMHVLHGAPGIDAFDNGAYSIQQDRSLAEGYQYVQELWVAGLFGVIALGGAKKFWWWSLLFVYFLVDDMRGVHEWFGDHLARFFHSFPGEPDKVGELAGVGMVGLFFTAVLYFSYRALEDEQHRRIFRLTAVAVVVLFVLGVGVDFFHSLLPDSRAVNVPMAILEDGGEMLVMSWIVWQTYVLAGLAGSTELFRPADQ